MTPRSEALETLRALPRAEWDAWLLRHSGLPGPRSNLGIVAAAADLATPEQMRDWLAYSPAMAPYGSAAEFLPLCGAVGLGRLLVEADGERVAQASLLDDLRTSSVDPRWRVREGVAMALQRWGAMDMHGLLDGMASWAASRDRLVQRAVVAALCEPPNLRDFRDAAQVVVLLDDITGSIISAADRKSEPFRVLRQALGYGWSVAVVACPDAGRAAMDRWLNSPDADVRWVMRENLGKARLVRVDPAWVAAARESISR